MNQTNKNKNLFCILNHLINSFQQIDETINLAPNGILSGLVVSLNEPFDWNINDGHYCQIMCLTMKSELLTDVFLCFNDLLDFVSESNRDSKSRLSKFYPVSSLF